MTDNNTDRWLFSIPYCLCAYWSCVWLWKCVWPQILLLNHNGLLWQLFQGNIYQSRLSFLVFIWQSKHRPYVVFRDTFYLVHDLLFVNMFSAWMRLEFWSRDVTSQSTIAYFILKSFNNVMNWNKSSVLRFYKSFGCKRTQQNIHTKLWNKTNQARDHPIVCYSSSDRWTLLLQ
jgi:hypothetical protein